MKKILTAAFLVATTLTACNDQFLEKYPLTDLTEENAFKEYNNFKAFMNPCYEMFTNTTIMMTAKIASVAIPISTNSGALFANKANVR